jgi:putative transposase
VGTSETAELFLRGLFETILSYGMMGALYVDGGPGFIATDTIEVVRKLGILFIRGSAGYPEGHGKVERFNRTAKDQLLRHLDGHPEVDPACAALELRINHYLREQYNLTPHQSLGQQTPWACFHEDKKPLRFAESQDRLRQSFILNTTRRVSNDNIVSLHGAFYQVVRGHAGARVMLYRNVLDGSVAIVHRGRFVRLAILDVHKNATEKRAGHPLQDKKDPHRGLTKSSAQMAFDEQMRPVVDPDGGFARPENHRNLKED